MRFIIVEDQTMFRHVLAAMIKERFPGVEVCECGTLAEIKDEDVAGAELIVLDLDLPDGNGLDWYEKQKNPPPTLILSADNTDYILHRAFESGAQGYVHKSEHEDTFFLAIKAVRTGSGFISPVIQKLRRRLQSDPVGFTKILSEREVEVLKLFAEGLSDNDIASLLGLKESSVADHRKTIMKKTETLNQAGLLRYAAEKGFANLTA